MAQPTEKKSLLNSDIQDAMMEGKIEAGVESQKKIERQRESDRITLMREITEGKLKAQGRGKYGGGGKLVKGLLELGRNLKAKATSKVRQSVDEGEVEIGLTNLDAFDYDDAIKMYQNGDLTLAEVNKNLKAAGYDEKDISDFMYVLSDTGEGTAQGAIEKRSKSILKQDKDVATDKRMKELTPPSEDEVEVMLDELAARGEFKTGGLLEDDRQMYGAAGKVIKKIKEVIKGGNTSNIKKQIVKLEKKLDAEIEDYQFTKDMLDTKEIDADDGLKNLEFLDTRIDSLSRQLELYGVTPAKKNIELRKGNRTNFDEGGKTQMSPEMSSDSDMEKNYTRFIMDEALSEKEEDMLVTKLEQDEELQMLFDKVIDVAQEFAGNGPVEGPGTGVSDDIPARLSDGEFVFTAKAVEEIGEDTLMSMMKEAEAEVDKRQDLAMGGTPAVEEEMKNDQYGNSVDPDITDDEIRKGMLSTNPRLK